MCEYKIWVLLHQIVKFIIGFKSVIQNIVRFELYVIFSNNTIVFNFVDTLIPMRRKISLVTISVKAFWPSEIEYVFFFPPTEIGGGIFVKPLLLFQSPFYRTINIL